MAHAFAGRATGGSASTCSRCGPRSTSRGLAPSAYAAAVQPTGRRGISAKLSATAISLISLISLASLIIRWPGLTQGRFASHDVGGILYNAMLLRSGGLPYVDSVEFKAPASFYLAALLGPDIAGFQLLANLVGLASLVLVAALAWRMWGPLAAVLAAALFAVHDAHLDSMDANYVTWALLPQVAAVLVALAAGLRREREPVSSAMSFGTWLLSGALCAVATLFKQPAGIVLVPVLVHALWRAPGDVRGEGRGVDVRAGLGVVLGFLLAHLPIALHYLVRGHLGALLAGYAGSAWGMAYIEHHAEVPLTSAAWEGLAATLYFLALPLALTGFAMAARPRELSPSQRATLRLLLVWAFAGLAGAAVGLRFYKGYFLAALPPFCLLAAAPWGLLGPQPWRRRGPVRWLAGPLLALLLARAGLQLSATRHDRSQPHDEGARKIAAHIAAHSAPGERIWVWGWHLWGVYAYSGRLSASPIYKTPGLLTRFEDDTWRRPAAPLTLLPDSPHAAALLHDLDVARPAFIALGGSVPRDRFVALRRLLAAAYERDRRLTVGKVEIWRRREPPP